MTESERLRKEMEERHNRKEGYCLGGTEGNQREEGWDGEKPFCRICKQNSKQDNRQRKACA